MTPEIAGRLVPVPTGLDEVKAKAGQAERQWELVTGAVTFLGAGGGAAIAAGLAVPPIAPFAAVVAAGSFFFKLRAKWAREDPPRPDYDLATEFRLPQLEPMVLMPPGQIPPGAAVASLLFAAAASVEATIVTMERAAGASAAAEKGGNEKPLAFAPIRVREAHDHAQRSASLTAGLHAAAGAVGPYLEHELSTGGVPGAKAKMPEPSSRASAHIVDMLDDRALGHVIASGVDARLLDVQVWRDPELQNRPLAQLLADAGQAAEEFGAALARWTQDVGFGGPGSAAPI